MTPTPSAISPLAALLIALVPAAPAAPVISEFLAANRGLETDDTGRSSDWIEIHNPDPVDVDLAGWSLTDDADDRQKWVFPSVTLPAGGYLRVWASGLDRRDPGQPLHTGFALDAGGEYLALFPPAGPPATEWNPYPKQFPGYSYGSLDGADGWFAAPTPGQANNSPLFTGYVRDTEFSHDRGFHDAPFAVTITTPTPGAIIRYTTDGSEPTPEHGTPYTGPVPISTTTVLRARAFLDGYVPSPTATQTYVFAESWLNQPAQPQGFPETWGNTYNGGTLDFNVHVAADYEMDPAVTSGKAAEILEALTSTLPVLCVTGQAGDLFGPDGVHGNARRGNDSFPVAVEFFDPGDPGSSFGVRAEIQAHGGAVREFAKKAFRLDFSGGAADGPLRHPLFPGSPAAAIDQLVLRGGGHDSFAARTRGFTSLDEYDLAGHASYLRDAFLRETEHAIGLLSPRGRRVHLCINGLYWGIYELHERPNARYAAVHAGGQETDWDVVHHTPSGRSGYEVLEGDSEAWDFLQQLSQTAESPDEFAQLAALAGPDNLLDHMIVRIWAGDHDWLGPATMPGFDGVNPTGNIAYYQAKNWYAIRRSRGAAPGPWHFFTWDGEISMGTHLLFLWPGVSPDLFPANFQWPVSQRQLHLDFTGVNSESTPAAPFAALLRDPELRLRAADRIRRHFFHDGVLTPAAVSARMAAMIAELDGPVLAESARWGDCSGYRFGVRNGLLVQSWENPRLTRDEHWRPEVGWLRDTFAAQRTGIVLEQFRARGVYPSTPPADITPFGGAPGDGETITLTTPAADAVILYTLDGTDPRTPGSGEPAPQALVYTGPITPPDLPFVLRCRVRQGTEWSALTEAVFTAALPPDAESLAITELHYHPPDPTPDEAAAGFKDDDDFEFVELTNVSGSPRLAATLRFAEGVDFDFRSLPPPAELAPGQSLVIASNAAAFAMRYGFPPAGEFRNGTRLSNSGEQLTLVTAGGGVIASFHWSDRGKWPASADGAGHSLHLIAPFAGTVESRPLNWHAAAPSPGAVDSSPMTYEVWSGAFFAPAEAELAAPGADPDGDGIVNAIEFLTKSHPRIPSPNPMTASENGGPAIAWERRVDAAAAPPSIAAEFSTNGAEWFPAESIPGTVVQESQTTDATVRTEVRFPAGIPRLLGRLRAAF